jgi:DNA-binding LacI/PurR family transcriptional regulator
MAHIIEPAHAKAAEKVRQSLAAYLEAEDLINIGAYKKGSNPIIDEAITKHPAIIEYLNEEGLLYVLIGKAQQFANLTIYIDNDNVLAGKEATDYLYDLGHRKIAYLGSESIKFFSADRKTGYQLSMLQHDLAVEKKYMIEVNDVYLDECKELLEMLRSEDRPTAIVVSDDILAVSLERVCIQCGLTIPNDLSIISFNDSLFARLTHPPLTSINVNSSQLGIEAASQLINHIENPNLVATKIIVPHSLVERESCRKLL